MGIVSFPEVKSGRGVTLTPHPLSGAVGRERVELYLYSPYGPYGLYRASVPVQGVHFKRKNSKVEIDGTYNTCRRYETFVYFRKTLRDATIYDT
jgi:hypothetical protein